MTTRAQKLSRLKSPFLQVMGIVLGLSLVTMTHAKGKLHLGAGAFSLNASTPSRSKTISGPGSYSVSYLHPLFRKLMLEAGYSVIMSEGISGDMGFGLDIGLTFYPLTESQEFGIEEDNVKVKIDEIWRPFLSGYFHQRQFQSVSSSYAGFGFGAGIERLFNEKYGLLVKARYQILAGPQSSSASNIDFLIGLMVKL